MKANGPDVTGAINRLEDMMTGGRKDLEEEEEEENGYNNYKLLFVFEYQPSEKPSRSSKKRNLSGRDKVPSSTHSLTPSLSYT